MFFYPELLPGMNEVISLVNRKWYKSKKKQYESRLGLIARASGVKPMESAHFAFIFWEKHRQRDPDNITGGARKILFDALQGAGILENDGWKQVLSIQSGWDVDKDKPGISVYMSEEKLDLDKVWQMELERKSQCLKRKTPKAKMKIKNS